MSKKKNKTISLEVTKETKISLKDLIFNTENINLLICLVIVLALFIPTLNRPWLTYDERIIYDSLYFPTPQSFGEIFEIFGNIGLNFNIISSNSIYSSNYISRGCPLSLILNLFTGLLFGKSPVLYHCFNLTLHLINICLFYSILRFCFSAHKQTNSFVNRCLLMISTLIWAVHPVMIESVLLSTNFGATFSYCFFFSFLLDFLINKAKNTSVIRECLIPIIFLIPMLTNE